MKPLKKIWMSGKFVSWKNATVHILTHAIHYGTAIFEGIRCYDTKNGPAIFRLKDHYSRLLKGANAYQFEVKYSIDELCEITKEVVRKNNVKSCYIRPICYVGNKLIGLSLEGAPFEFAIIPVDFDSLFKNKDGIKAKISSWKRINTTILSPHVKASANYLNSVLAKKEAVDDGYDEAIMLADSGHVAEGSGENIFIVRDEKLITPPLHDSILGGITRESVIEIAKEMGIRVEEKTILRDELYSADEAFFCGTAAEITPIAEIDRRKISKSVGKITKEIQETYSNVVRAKDERFIKWLSFINTD